MEACINFFYYILVSAYLSNGYHYVRLFKKIDQNGDGLLSAAELRALIIGIQIFEEIDKDDAVAKMMNDFDTSHDFRVDENEFVAGISRWLNEAKRSGDVSSDPGHKKMKFITDFHVVSFVHVDL